MELYNRNIINGEDNIGELLTGNADDNTEGIEQSSPQRVDDPPPKSLWIW